jgi:hypothetical protein
MKKILISSALIILALLLLFGCTNTGLNLTCPDGQLVMDISECVESVDATVTVSANIPWDIEGDVFLRWYKSQEISSNLSSSVITRLGEHWLGSQNKNLYISFTDSESGELPITRENNEVVVSIPEQGEYYFELASEDYEYRAVSEKVLVTQNGDTQLYLNLVPSNPAIRIRGVGESWERLSGPGKVTLFATRHYDNYGEWTEDTFEYGSMTFSDGEEINALFFVNSYNISQNESISYFTEVEKDGYLSTRQNIWVNGKINVYDIQLRQANPPGTGDLEVQIVPGQGTTWEDVGRLNGEMALLTMVNSPYTQYTTTIDASRIVTFDNIDFGTYTLSAANGEYSSDIPFVTIANQEIEVSLAAQSAQVQALLGSSMHLTVLDSTGELIPKEQLKNARSRLFVDGELRYDFNNSPPTPWPANPMIQARGFYDEYSLEIENASVYYLTLAYNGLEQEFMIDMKQGRNEVVWQFDAPGATSFSPSAADHIFYFSDIQGERRNIPLMIDLSLGTNTIQIDNKNFEVDLNIDANTLTFDSGSIVRTRNLTYATDNVLTGINIQFDLSDDGLTMTTYNIFVDEPTSRAVLLLTLFMYNQSFYGGEGRVESGSLYDMPFEVVSTPIKAYTYLPDISGVDYLSEVYNLNFNEGDNEKSYFRMWVQETEDRSSRESFFIDTTYGVRATFIAIGDSIEVLGREGTIFEGQTMTITLDDVLISGTAGHPYTSEWTLRDESENIVAVKEGRVSTDLLNEFSTYVNQSERNMISEINEMMFHSTNVYYAVVDTFD